MNRQGNITGEVLLLCERTEIAQFMHAYLRHLFKQGQKLPHIQIINFQGIEQLPNFAQRLTQLAKEEKVRAVLFLLDAAAERERKLEKLFAVRDTAFFKDVERCTHFFFPGKKETKRWQQGYLEDALWTALKHETAEYNDYYNLHNMSAEYLTLVNNNRGREQHLKNYSRHLLYTYFAATEKYVGIRLGEAALMGAFDLQHAAFNSLKECLDKVFSE